MVFWPALPSVRDPTRRRECVNNLKQIALALHSYHDDYGCLPPAVVCDAEGKPMHSWRVLILPYLARGDIYQQYAFSQPWDGPKNRLLASQIPYVYRCPSAPTAGGAGCFITNYVVITGPGTLWPGCECGQLDSVRDGIGKTLLVAEWADSDIHWMEPRDLSLPDSGRPQRLAQKSHSGHGYETGDCVVEKRCGGGNVVMADGTFRYLHRPFSAKGLAAFALHSDGEPGDDLESEEYFGPECVVRWVHWGHVIGLSLFVATFVVLLWKAMFGPIDKVPQGASSTGHS